MKVAGRRSQVAAVVCTFFSSFADDVCSQNHGAWLAPFSHPNTAAVTDPVAGGAAWPTTFNAVHMAVIPNRNSSEANANDVVIAWDLNHANQNLSTATGWPQRYTVGNPEVPASFVNFRVVIPLGPVENGNAVFYGDLFCAGHCWLPDGRLFVAGGNAQYNPFFLGSRYVGIWDPLWAHSAANNYGWTHLAGGSEGIPMRLARWYPTCTLISNRYVMVSGGVTRTGTLGGGVQQGDRSRLGHL